MAQSFMAGMTSYENQSLTDIVEDIMRWIAYSEKTKDKIIDLLSKLKNTRFYSQIPYDYKAMIHEIPQICQTNIDDMRRTLEVIQSHALTQGAVDLFWKVGKRAIENGNDNKKYYKSRDDGYWHDYDNIEFRMVEDIYAMFGDYCATLWDVTNAASRLKDYIDVPKEVTTMKIENNSVHIGNNNQISNSVIGSQNTAEIEQETVVPEQKEESLASKSFWQILVPIVVGVIVVAICVALGLS